LSASNLKTFITTFFIKFPCSSNPATYSPAFRSEIFFTDPSDSSITVSPKKHPPPVIELAGGTIKNDGTMKKNANMDNKTTEYLKFFTFICFIPAYVMNNWLRIDKNDIHATGQWYVHFMIKYFSKNRKFCINLDKKYFTTYFQ
jgi:hypothetical protein